MYGSVAMSLLGAVQGNKKKKGQEENHSEEHLFDIDKFPSEPGLSRHFYSLVEKSPDLACCLAT